MHRSSLSLPVNHLARVREVCVVPDVPGVFFIDLDAHVGSLAASRATSLAMEAQIVRARLAMKDD